MLPLPVWVLAAHAAALLLGRRRNSQRSLSDPETDPCNCADGAAAAPGRAFAPPPPLPPLPTEQHPHLVAIDGLQALPPPLLLPPAAPVLPPAPLDSGKEEYVWVDTVPQLAACAMELYEQDRVAVDVEHHAQHSYAGVTCLIQLSTGTKEFLIDCLALPRADVRSLLAPVLSNPRICKVVHGGSNDVAWLQRDYSLFLLNVFDTEKACQVLGFQQRSLGLLLQRYCGVSTDKSFGQRADWRQRPLPPELLEYARRDVRHLLFIADCLGQLLVQGAGAAAHAHEVSHQPGERPCAQPGQQQEQQKTLERQQQQPGKQQQPSKQPPGERQEQPQRGEQQHATLPEERLPAFAPSAAAPPHPSVVHLSPAARQALEAAMAAPQSRLRRAVHRSQALTLQLYQPTRPEAAVAAAAGGIVRQAVAAAHEGHARLTEQQLMELETLADCVHALAGWRDAAARAADEGLQCLLPDAALLALASAAAATVAPEAGNMCGRHQGLTQPRLLALLPTLPGPEPACGSYPAALRCDAHAVAALLSEAAAGQRPWVSPELQEVLAAAAGGTFVAGGGGGGGSKAHKRRDPEAFRQRLAERFSCKRVVYENCRLYSMHGELLCHTDRRKIEWYIRKGLAVQTGDDPLCASLNFQHKTTDQEEGTSDFYTVHKQNRCVACGEEGHYLRYRVVPCCYRKAMPVALKSHRSHDVVLLCVACHELAQQAAEKLKQQLATECNVPLQPPRPLAVPWPPAARGQRALQAAAGGGGGEASAADAAAAAAAAKPDMHPHNVRRSALALQRYADSMPARKRRQLEAQVRAYLDATGSLIGAGSSGGSATSGVAGSSSEAAISGRAAGTAAGAPAAEGSPEKPAAGEGGLTPVELYSGLLAGLARRTRRRTLQRWLKQGHQLPAELAEEVEAVCGVNGAAGAAAFGEAGAVEEEAEQDGEEAEAAAGEQPSEECSTASSQQQRGAATEPAHQRNTGHAWHGQQVVEQVLAAGGEEGLLELCKQFRECFMEALQPSFLPPGWAVHHRARREFGEHSIYRDGGGGGSPGASGSPAASSPQVAGSPKAGGGGKQRQHI